MSNNYLFELKHNVKKIIFNPQSPYKLILFLSDMEWDFMSSRPNPGLNIYLMRPVSDCIVKTDIFFIKD